MWLLLWRGPKDGVPAPIEKGRPNRPQPFSFHKFVEVVSEFTGNFCLKEALFIMSDSSSIDSLSDVQRHFSHSINGHL